MFSVVDGMSNSREKFWVNMQWSFIKSAVEAKIGSQGVLKILDALTHLSVKYHLSHLNHQGFVWSNSFGDYVHHSHYCQGQSRFTTLGILVIIDKSVCHKWVLENCFANFGSLVFLCELIGLWRVSPQQLSSLGSVCLRILQPSHSTISPYQIYLLLIFYSGLWISVHDLCVASVKNYVTLFVFLKHIILIRNLYIIFLNLMIIFY